MNIDYISSNASENHMALPHFHPISMDAMAAYLAYFEHTPRRASDYTFANLWGWAEQYGMQWRFEHGLCWLCQTLPTERHWAPVGPWHETDWLNIPLFKTGASFVRVPDELITIWRDVFGDRLQVEESQSQWDYLYTATDLAELKGNRFHRKKNHVNRFIKQYGLDYRPMTPDCIEDVLDMQQDWCLWRECAESESLLAENEAVVRVLEEWDRIPNLLGGSLYIDGKMAAYTVGEALDDDTLVVHFEKGHGQFSGVYQAINAEFIRHEGQPFQFVNREQDLGDEGLRHAKQSYYPVGFVRKDRVVILGE